jgi:NAD(P)-dependent dehydrogenase (short-subunit alcohol dehydrogenase family)
MNNRHTDGAEPNTLLITGASRGIGAATALAAARLGHDIVLNYARDERAARSIAESIRAIGRRAAIVQGDVGRGEDIRRMFETIETEIGPLRGLINNAGITGPIGSFRDTTEETIEQVFRVNVLGAMQCARETLANFRRHGTRGVIVNISSIAARTGSPGEYVHYAASKAALEHMTRCWALEFAADGIRVNAVAAGPTETRFLEDRMQLTAEQIEAVKADERARIPMGRRGEPEDIAPWIVSLATPGSVWITGQILRVDGGLAIA